MKSSSSIQSNETVIDPTKTALSIENLEIGAFRRGKKDLNIIRGISLDLKVGASLGLVGESGCGKSTIALSIARYLPPGVSVTRGSINVAGIDILGLDKVALRNYRAKVVSSVYQDPSSSLNPTMKIGKQIAESFVFGAGLSDKGEIQGQIIKALERVRFADPEKIAERYPHQLSGGQQQRVVIAMALAAHPKLLILDEPTTGLDATVEAEVLELIRELRSEYGTSVVMISHSLSVVSQVCDDIGVLYGGKLVEIGSANEVLNNPKHPYSAALLECIPQPKHRKTTHPLFSISGSVPSTSETITGCVFASRCPIVTTKCLENEPESISVGGSHRSACHHIESVASFSDSLAQTPPSDTGTGSLATRPKVIEVKSLEVTYKTEVGELMAVCGATFEIAQGEIVGLVGESGSGKSSLAKALVGIEKISSGTIQIHKGDGTIDDHPSGNSIQIVMQNPDSSLNPRRRVGALLDRYIKKFHTDASKLQNESIQTIAQSVSLRSELLDAFPRELSGGQRQRVVIACAISTGAPLVVCDEPTSALDVSVQAAVLNLLVSLQRDKGVAMLFISHDLGVVRYLADRVIVMYLGEIIEIVKTSQIDESVHHPYTVALLSAFRGLGDKKESRLELHGELPSPMNPPSGCRFRTRCPYVIEGKCDTEKPTWKVYNETQYLCHLEPQELLSIKRTAKSKTLDLSSN